MGGTRVLAGVGLLHDLHLHFRDSSPNGCAMGNPLIKEDLQLTLDWHFFQNIIVQSYCLSLPYTHTVPQFGENPATLCKTLYATPEANRTHVLIIHGGGINSFCHMLGIGFVLPGSKHAVTVPMVWRGSDPIPRPPRKKKTYKLNLHQLLKDLWREQTSQ